MIKPSNTIRNLVMSLRNDGYNHDKISHILGCGTSMVSRYKNENFNPSIDVAVKAYINLGEVLHPYAEDSLIYEAEIRGVVNDEA